MYEVYNQASSIAGRLIPCLVVDDNDPLKQGRILVYNIGIADKPFYVLPVTKSNCDFQVPQKGSQVLVYFRNNDPHSGVYLGVISTIANKTQSKNMDLQFSPLFNLKTTVTKYDPDESNDQSRYDILHEDEFTSLGWYYIPSKLSRLKNGNKDLTKANKSLQDISLHSSFFISNRSSWLLFDTTNVVTGWRLELHAPTKKSVNPFSKDQYISQELLNSQVTVTHQLNQYTSNLAKSIHNLQDYDNTVSIVESKEIVKQSSLSQSTRKLQVSGNYIEEVSIVSSSSASYTVTVNHGSSSITIQALPNGTIVLKAQSITLDCNSCTITGNTTIEANLHVSGNTTIDGTMTADCCNCGTC